MNGFPTKRAAEIDVQPEEQRWLIESLWGDQAVGLVGGEPKSHKSFLALDAAVSVASGTPCLRRFRTPERGPVLFFAAEDALHIVRERLEGIAAAAQLSLSGLDVHLITTPVVRIDLPDHQRKLNDTIERIRPRLVVLDPFVRLHRKDENVASEVSPLLAYLRELQRRHHTAVMLVHHARKGAGKVRAGQALRGSSELHAWGDSNLYVRWRREALDLIVEHRAAPAPPRLRVALHEQGPALALRVVEDEQPSPPPPTLEEKIVRALLDASTSLTLRQIREACRARTETVCKELAALVAAGRLVKQGPHYALATPGISTDA